MKFKIEYRVGFHIFMLGVYRAETTGDIWICAPFFMARLRKVRPALCTNCDHGPGPHHASKSAGAIRWKCCVPGCPCSHYNPASL